MYVSTKLWSWRVRRDSLLYVARNGSTSVTWLQCVPYMLACTQHEVNRLSCITGLSWG